MFYANLMLRCYTVVTLIPTFHIISPRLSLYSLVTCFYTILSDMVLLGPQLATQVLGFNFPGSYNPDRFRGSGRGVHSPPGLCLDRRVHTAPQLGSQPHTLHHLGYRLWGVSTQTEH